MLFWALVLVVEKVERYFAEEGQGVATQFYALALCLSNDTIHDLGLKTQRQMKFIFQWGH